MSVELFAFLVFSIITIGGGLGVVLSRNLIRAALWLLFSLFGVAGLLAILAAPFLAMVQILIYMGGIAILIIFAVMLTRSMVSQKKIYNSQVELGLVIGALFLVLMVGVIAQVSWDGAPLASDDVPAVGSDTTVRLGTALVSPSAYVLPFELASLLLAGALVGAIYIARDDDEDEAPVVAEVVGEAVAAGDDEKAE